VSLNHVEITEVWSLLFDDTIFSPLLTGTECYKWFKCTIFDAKKPWFFPIF
jgi:hypothetical protein